MRILPTSMASISFTACMAPASRSFILHGGVNPDSFGSNLAELAKGRQVIAVHLQAHGRTPDTDGSEIGLRARIVDIDLAARVVTSEMRAQRWRGGRLEADETYPLKACVYFREELVAMLAQAGFGTVEVSRGYGGTGERESTVLVFEAERDP